MRQQVVVQREGELQGQGFQLELLIHQRAPVAVGRQPQPPNELGYPVRQLVLFGHMGRGRGFNPGICLFKHLLKKFDSDPRPCLVLWLIGL